MLIASDDISTFNGRINYLSITENGEDILRGMGYLVERKRQGGPEHEYWKYRIAAFLRSKGYVVDIEQPIGEGKTIDVVACRGGEKIAIEVETGKSDVGENIIKNIHGEFSRLVVVPVNSRARANVNRALNKGSRTRIGDPVIISPGEIFRKNAV